MICYFTFDLLIILLAHYRLLFLSSHVVIPFRDMMCLRVVAVTENKQAVRVYIPVVLVGIVVTCSLLFLVAWSVHIIRYVARIHTLVV